MRRRYPSASPARRGVLATSLVVVVVVALAAPSWATPGAVVWTTRFNGPTNKVDSPTALATSPDGTKVFVTGSSASIYTSYDYVTIGYSTTNGAPVWTRFYNGPDGLADMSKAMTVSADGTKVFVTGRSTFGGDCQSPGGCTDYATQALNATTGAVLWAQRYHTGPHTPSDPAAIAMSLDGSKVFVTGKTWSLATGQDFATIAYNAATGAVVWSKRYNSQGALRDEASQLKVSPDGTKVFVIGRSHDDNTNGSDWVTVAYNAANGTQQWLQRNVTPTDDEPTALAVSPDSSKVIVTGWDSNATTATDYVTVAYGTATGAVVWTKRLNSSGNGGDQAWGIAASADGSKVFVTGGSKGDYLTAGYRVTDGLFLWAVRTDGPAHHIDTPTAISVSPNGTRVYVTGDSESAHSSGGSHSYTYDYATVAYVAGTGAIAWTSRYDGPIGGEDSAKAIGVSPNSARVFVTGVSPGSGTPTANTSTADDYATIAYSAT